jgi:hypothetical protein
MTMRELADHAAMLWRLCVARGSRSATGGMVASLDDCPLGDICWRAIGIDWNGRSPAAAESRCGKIINARGT